MGIPAWPPPWIPVAEWQRPPRAVFDGARPGLAPLLAPRSVWQIHTYSDAAFVYSAIHSDWSCSLSPSPHPTVGGGGGGGECGHFWRSLAGMANYLYPSIPWRSECADHNGPPGNTDRNTKDHKHRDKNIQTEKHRESHRNPQTRASNHTETHRHKHRESQRITNRNTYRITQACTQARAHKPF